MTRTILLIITAMIIARIGSSETWISVKNKSIRLTDTSSCRNIAEKDEQTACDCCLIKRSVIEGLGTANAFDACERSKHCRVDENADVMEQNPYVALKTAKTRLKAMTIVRIERLLKPPKLPKDGVLSSTDVGAILKSLHANGHLPLPSPLFADNKVLKIKPLSNSAKGFWSGQLFSIQYDAYYVDPEVTETGTFRPLYILKETKKGLAEIANLHKVYASKLGDEKYATVDIMLGNTKARSNTIANISFDDLHFKFTTGGKTRYFSLLQTAPGRSFHKILKEFGELAKAKDLDDEELLIAYKKTKHIFYRVGFAMSELHQKYNPNNERNPLDLSNTLIHGDLHSENIFYDEDSDKVTLIDNETFAFSLSNPCSGVNDIVDLYMVHTIRLIAHNLTNQFTSNEEFGINDTLWHELWRHLFYGYFDAFGDISKEDFDVLYAEVRKDFFKSFSHLNIFSALKNLVDQRKLKRLGLSDRRKYIQKIELVRLFERTYNSHAKQYEIP